MKEQATDGLRLAAAIEAESDMPATGACAREMGERALIWQGLSEIERRFVVEDAVALYLAWRRREIERLDRLIEAGSMDALDDQLDAHRKEKVTGEEPVPKQPPSGVLACRPPVNGQGEQWEHRVYDFLAEQSDWVSIPQMIKAFDVPDHKIYGGVDRLQRLGLVVEGPSVVAESGRRVKMWALKRVA